VTSGSGGPCPSAIQGQNSTWGISGADEYDSMKWKKNQYGDTKVVAQAAMFAHWHKKWAGPIGSAANEQRDVGDSYISTS